MDLARRPARGLAFRRLAAVAAALAVAAACTGPGPGGSGDRPTPPPTTAAASAATTTAVPGSPADAEPRHLTGRPLSGPTRLVLLVAGDPPRVVDVDRSTSRRVEGLPAGQEPVSVAAVGRDAIVTADQQVFLLRRGSFRATPLGRGLSAVASRDGRGVSPGDPGAVLDRRTGRALPRWAELHGVAGDQVLWGGPERDAGPFTLTDRRTGTSHRVARPTPYGEAGIGEPRPDGRLLAVEFADPSWSRVHGQVSDIWLLDVRTRRWRRLPGMPLITGLKAMSMAWTDDGRLLLVGDFDRFGKALASWRPGQDHLALRRLPLPDGAGSDSFVPWPAPGP